MFRSAGFIGTGNMGTALAGAVYRSGADCAVMLSDHSPQKAKAAAEALGGAPVCSNEEIAKGCDLIFLAVKPQIMKDVISSIAPVLGNRTLKGDRFILVSPAAGIAMESIREMTGMGVPVIRLMPNTPIAIGKGVIEYSSLGVSGDELAAFEKLLAPAGLLDPVDEKLIDAACALSGCGPAFVYMFIEALADGAVACGLPRAKALAYAAKTVEGAAAMALESGKHPGELKDAVCSPAGATIEGVLCLEDSSFRGAAAAAVKAAYEKTLSLK